MKYLTTYFSSTKKSRFIFLNKMPFEYEGEPNEKKQIALEYLQYAGQKSILINDEERKLIEAIVQVADMTETFSPDKVIPDCIVVDFLAQRPPLIILNQIIHKTRETQSANPNDRFVDIFKIVVAFYLWLIT